MPKKIIITLIVGILLVGAIVICRQTEIKEKPKWTKSSEGLLKMKKYPKKPMTKKNLFDN